MFWREEKDGITLFVRLTPKAAKDVVSGAETAADGKTYLNVRVRAIPEDGKANKALIKFLAKSLRIAPSAFTLAAGATARIKQLHIHGDRAHLSETLNKLMLK